MYETQAHLEATYMKVLDETIEQPCSATTRTSASARLIAS